MSAPQQVLSDLIVVAASRQASVERRIERRLEVLREWVREGVPAGKTFPASLTGARNWNDPELDIFSVRSPNDFTTTHPLYGSRIRDIAGLLTVLVKRYKHAATAATKRSANAAAKFDRKAFDKQLENVMSQWHTERDQRLHEKRRADAADARSAMLTDENAQKDGIIADLRRQITSSKGLRVVE